MMAVRHLGFSKFEILISRLRR